MAKMDDSFGDMGDTFDIEGLALHDGMSEVELERALAGGAFGQGPGQGNGHESSAPMAPPTLTSTKSISCYTSSVHPTDSQCSSQFVYIPETWGGGGAAVPPPPLLRRSSSAMSTERDDGTVLDQLASVPPSRSSVAQFNKQSGLRWVDFSSGEGNTRLQNIAAALWGGGGNRGADHDDDDDDDDDPFRPRQLRPRGVRFQPPTLNKVYIHMGLWEMTEEEKRDTWLDETDHEDLQIDVIKNVKAMRRNQPLDEENGLCIRGLEYLQSTAKVKARESHKRTVVDAVMQTQEVLNLNGIDDPEAIAKVSMEKSRQAKEIAAAFGRRDAAYLRGGRRGRLMSQSEGPWTTESHERKC